VRVGLLDALVGHFADGRPIQSMDPRQQRVQSILDHLGRLLNARRGMLAHLPVYGLPDIQEIYQAMPGSVEFLGRIIRATVETYEPRLRRVEVVEQVSDDSEFRISFLVRGEVIGGERVKFITTFSASGQAKIGAGGVRG